MSIKLTTSEKSKNEYDIGYDIGISDIGMSISSTNDIVAANGLNAYNITSTNQYATIATSDVCYNKSDVCYDKDTKFYDIYNMQQIAVSYFKTNGMEEVIFVKKDNIISLTRKNKLTFSLSKKFPFLKIKNIECTDLAYFNDSNPKKCRHIYALEQPLRLANKIGISYDKANDVDLVNDDLGV